MKLREILASGAVIIAAATAQPATAVSMLTLFNANNIPDQINTPYSITFIANQTYSAIYFYGWNENGFSGFQDTSVQLNGQGPNLESSTWGQYSNGPTTYKYRDGNSLYFGNYTPGRYDIYTNLINTVAGESYTVSFGLYSRTTSNGLMIQASNADFPPPPAVPEPATWAMMLAGFGMIGFGLRSYRKRMTVRFI